MKLTKVQKTQLENLKENKKLFVGYNCPSIMRTFNILVKKGYAEVSQEYPGLGKDFVPIA